MSQMIKRLIIDGMPLQINFPPRKEKKEKIKKKKICSPNSQGSGGCQGFCQNTTRPKGGVEIVTKTRRA